MVWFVLSIELTLHWNQVQGVNGLESTGQLIPFIIGVVSTAQAVKKVTITTIKKVRVLLFVVFAPRPDADCYSSCTPTGPIPH